MRLETRRKALIAAARIAAGAAVLSGCTGPGAPPPDVAADPAPTEATAPVAPPTAEEVAACTEVVDKAKFDGTVAADVKSCCAKLATDADAKQSFTFPRRDECCAALDWHGAAACTPWGPPMPPTMRADA